MSLKLMSVVGARPNFMKIAPLVRAIECHNRNCDAANLPADTGASRHIQHILVHTGQHYDERMSHTFFDALHIPRPDIDLEIGSGTHAEQVGRTMIAFEKVIREHPPDWVVLVGDVNATCACAITTKKENIKLAHIEAGLRSFDMTMPEEINRLVTDRLSDLLFTTDQIATDNLKHEGVPASRIYMVGNIMIDTLEQHRAQASAIDLKIMIDQNLQFHGTTPPPLSEDHYMVMTLHRPSNVDDPIILRDLMEFIIKEAAQDMPILWPIHPRTLKQLEAFGLLKAVRACKALVLLAPLGYHEMLKLNMHACVMLTDSGGLQEECCVLGTPCLTLRWNTERPATLKEHGGASLLVGNDIEKLRHAYQTARNQPRRPFIPPLWDGHTADRIVKTFTRQLIQPGMNKGF